MPPRRKAAEQAKSYQEEEEEEEEVTIPSKKKSNTSLAVGDAIPATIDLLNHEGEAVNLLDLCKNKKIIIFMVPKANTPGNYVSSLQEVVRNKLADFVMNFKRSKTRV